MGTFFPCFANPIPKLLVVVVLPTPPFWFAIAIILHMVLFLRLVRFFFHVGLGYGILKHGEGIDLMPGNIELSGLEVSLVNVMSREIMTISIILHMVLFLRLVRFFFHVGFLHFHISPVIPVCTFVPV